jgi:hypothetical protein
MLGMVQMSRSTPVPSRATPHLSEVTIFAGEGQVYMEKLFSKAALQAEN